MGVSLMGSQSPDMVNSPSHYQLDGLEAIDIIKASLTADEYLGYLKGNALKYMLREPFKGNSKQDVAKEIGRASCRERV